MDHSWRPPPIPGNICPICSISHFPFCPPPPPFTQNPRFQNDYYHQPPPFPNHPNYLPNSTDPRRPTWMTSQNYNNYPNYYGYDGYDNCGVGIKRMRMEAGVENNRGQLMGGEIGVVPSDNERILKLIHDHGNATTPSNGLKRRHEEVSSANVHYYDQRNELGQSLDYSSPPAAADVMQPNHSFLSSDNRNSQSPCYWPESKAHYYSPNSFRTNLGPMEVHHGYSGQPPLPPPLPTDIPRSHFFEPHASPPPPKPSSLFPVAVTSSADSSLSGSAVLKNQSSAPVYLTNNASRLASAEEFHVRQSSSEKHARDIQSFPLRQLSTEKPNIIDGSHIFKQPHRASRPDHFVIILRGLPGSGKSYLAKVLRDIEVENGGEAPRIHSMDEYFMVEVEKAEDVELSKSSSSRGKRQAMKTVMEYCYEPEMEEAYRASMLKAFKKTLDEGVYSFIIVDDRNLRVADFAQFWATAKRSGYEVYLVEASYKDPAGCAARNVHNFTLPDIQKMAGLWEEAPALYLKMDVKSLLHGDGFDESGIEEVDMDMEDEDATDASQGSDVKRSHDETEDQVDDSRPRDEQTDVTVTKHQAEEVKDLSRSKWSNDIDEEEGGTNKNTGGALSGLVQAYSRKEAKSVCWGDQGGNVGFSISAARKTNTRSLVIGPGPGYNLKSNPLSEEEYLNAVEPRSQSVFQERIRAERESFKAVFDKRRQRITMDDE